MAKIMVVAGGTWQVPLIKKVKTLGHQVINTNLYEDSPGFVYSDFSEIADVLDVEKNFEVAKKYKIDAIITDQSDIAVPTIAYIADKLKLPNIGVKLADLFTNKYLMREYCQQNDFTSPEYKICSKPDEVVDFFNKIQAKIIIKPLDSQSSRGVFTINNVSEIDSLFEIAKSFSKDKIHVLAERYIEGTEFTVDGVVVNGTHTTLAVSEKSHFGYNKNIAQKLFFSYDNPNFDYEFLRKQHNKLIDSTGLPFGLTHAEYKYEDGKFYLIEMAARGGGTKISSDIVPFVSGVDNYLTYITSSLGSDDNLDVDFGVLEDNKNRCAVLEFLDVDSNGRMVKSIFGVDEINAIPEVVDFGLEFSVGDTIEKADDDRSRVGYFIVCAETREEVENISERIKGLLKFTFE